MIQDAINIFPSIFDIIDSREKFCGIYKITSPSGKIYIGQSSNLKKRYFEYKNALCKKQAALYNTIIKYGFESLKFEIICFCKEDELNELEIKYIEQFNSFDTANGLNLKSGGRFFKFSTETKERMSKTRKELYSQGKIIPPNKGKHLSEETKLKLRIFNTGKAAAFKGRKHSEKSKELIRWKRKNQVITASHRLSLSRAFSGEKNPMFGKTHSGEVRKKISEKVKLAWKRDGYKEKESERRIGKIMPELVREKIGKANKGKIRSEESRKRYSEASKRRWETWRIKKRNQELNINP